MIYTLKDLLVIKNGRDHKDLMDGMYPVYGSGGIMRYVNDYLYDKPSILLPRKGTLSNIQYSNQPFWTVDTIYYTEIKEDIVNPLFLFYCLSLLDLSNLDTGTGVPSMTFDSYYNIKIDLPLRSIQDSIASILSTIDRKISLNRKANEVLEKMAKQLYDYWFVQFDFPDENGKPYKSSGGKMVYNDTLKREIPEGWEVKKLGEVLCVLKDGTHNPPQREEHGVALLTGYMFGDNFLDYTKATYINEKDYQSIHSAYAPQEGDVVITKIGTVGKVNILTEQDIPLTIHCNSALLRYKEPYNGLFAYWYTKSDLFKQRLFSKIGHSIQQFVNLENISSILFEAPNEDIVHGFNNTIKPIYNKMAAIRNESLRLTSLRDFLLPMLMNGQVTIKDEQQ